MNWRFIGAVALVVVVGGIVLFHLNPANSRLYPACPLHQFTGLYCPGCGSLRAVHQLLHGNLGAAMRLNPLLVLALPAILILCLKPSWAYRVWLPWVALGTLIAYGILRNIPAWPFSLLAPH